MGCGKSKHDVAAENTITRTKSDAGSNRSNDIEPAVKETSPQDSNANILAEQKEKQIASKESSKEVVAGVQDVNREAVAVVQDANVVGVQDANVEGVAGVQNANVGAVAGVQNATVEAVAGVQDATVEAVAGVRDANENEEWKEGGKDVETKEENVVEKQEPGKLTSEESPNNVVSSTKDEDSQGIVSEGRSEKESSSDESGKSDDVSKELLVEETKQEAENEEPQVVKHEHVDEEAKPDTTIEPEVASPTAKELEENSQV